MRGGNLVLRGAASGQNAPHRDLHAVARHPRTHARALVLALGARLSSRAGPCRATPPPAPAPAPAPKPKPAPRAGLRGRGVRKKSEESCEEPSPLPSASAVPRLAAPRLAGPRRAAARALRPAAQHLPGR